MKKFSTTIALIFLPFQAYAINDADQQSVINQQNQIIQNQRQFEREKEREVDLKQVEKEQKEIEEEREYLQKNDGKIVQDLRAIQCFRIQQIKFSPNQIISKRQEKSFVKNHLGKCLTIQKISELGKEVSNFLAQKGYATSRAEIAPQVLSQGVLTINIVESYLEKIVFNNDRFFDRMQKFTAFGFVSEGEILNLNKIDQGIDQINRLQSNQAVAKLLPGEKASSSIVSIENRPKDSSRIDVTYDNSGNQITGSKRETISFSQDNLLHLNDSFTISRTSNDLDPLHRERYTKAFSGAISIPFVNHKLSLSYSKSEYSFMMGSLTRFRSHGHTSTKSVSLDSVLFESKKFKAASTFNLNNRSNENFGERGKIEVSSRVSSIASASISGTFFLNNASLFLKPTYSKSLTIMNGAKNSEYLYSDSARAEFNLFKFYGNYAQKIALPYLKTPASYNIGFDSQYTKQRLYGNDKFSVGGVYSVRGFKNGTISDDTGYNIRNEITLNLGQLILPHLAYEKIPTALGYLNNLSLAPFYDFGSVRGAHGEESGKISGTGLKLALNYKKTNASLTYSRAVSKSQLLLQNYNESSAIYFDLGMEIGFF